MYVLKNLFLKNHCIRNANIYINAFMDSEYFCYSWANAMTPREIVFHRKMSKFFSRAQVLQFVIPIIKNPLIVQILFFFFKLTLAQYWTPKGVQISAQNHIGNIVKNLLFKYQYICIITNNHPQLAYTTCIRYILYLLMLFYSTKTGTPPKF